MEDNPYGLKKVKQKKENKSGKNRPKGKTSKFDTNQKNKLRIRKLRKINKRGRVTGNIKKLGNLNRKDALRPENMEGKGMSGLGADYGKQEEKLQTKVEKHRKSKTYKKNIAKHNERLRNKGKKTTGGTTGGGTTGGGSNKTSGTKTPAGYVRYKGRLYSKRSAQGMKAMNRLKAKKRAQDMAKKRK